MHGACDLLRHDGQGDRQGGGQPNIAAQSQGCQQIVHHHTHQAANGVALDGRSLAGGYFNAGAEAYTHTHTHTHTDPKTGESRLRGLPSPWRRVADDAIFGLRHGGLEAAEENHGHGAEGSHQQGHLGLGKQEVHMHQADGAHAAESTEEAPGQEPDSAGLGPNPTENQGCLCIASIMRITT